VASGVENDLPLLRAQADPMDPVTTHLLDRLLIATDYAKGCASLGEAGLGPPIVPVARTLTENFISGCWAALSRENGGVAIEAGRREMTRVMLLNLRAGHATIRHRSTGEDRTREFMNDPAVAADAQRLPRFDRMAEAAGLKKLYDTIYGMQSLLSHASATDLLARRQQDQLIHAQLSTASAILQCTHLILTNRIREKRITTKTEFEAILKVSL
jgi:hypothetical protein